MTRGLIFWILMLVWFVFGLLINLMPGNLGSYSHLAAGADLLLFFVLFVLIGWQVFGPPVHG